MPHNALILFTNTIYELKIYSMHRNEEHQIQDRSHLGNGIREGRVKLQLPVMFLFFEAVFRYISHNKQHILKVYNLTHSGLCIYL